MTDFDFDILQKKRIARNAKYKKNGSKSRRCPMSTDHMTQKQWRERCGNVMTYQFRRPMAWREFVRLPADIQKEYIMRIVENFSPAATDLARVFNVTAKTIRRFCEENSIDIGASRGRRMPKEKQDEFERFLTGEVSDSSDAEPTDNAEDTDNAQILPEKIALSEFEFDFKGAFDRNTVYNYMSLMIPQGTDVKLKIKCIISSEII